MALDSLPATKRAARASGRIWSPARSALHPLFSPRTSGRTLSVMGKASRDKRDRFYRQAKEEVRPLQPASDREGGRLFFLFVVTHRASAVDVKMQGWRVVVWLWIVLVLNADVKQGKRRKRRKGRRRSRVSPSPFPPSPFTLAPLSRSPAAPAPLAGMARPQRL